MPSRSRSRSRNRSHDLLDEMTQILAYIGDRDAQDGYPDATFRDERLTLPQVIFLMTDIIYILNNEGIKLIQKMPDDIKIKVDNLKVMFDESSRNKKKELITYIKEYLNELYTSDEIHVMRPVHGGRRTRRRRH